MKKNLLLSFVVLLSALFTTHSSFAQCTGNTSSYGSLSSSNVLNAVQTISTCNFTTEYSTVSNLLVGGVYEFGLSSTPGYVTVMTGPGGTGTVVAHGAPPLIFVATAATLYPHWNDNAACAGSSNCYTTTLTYTAAPASCIQPISLNAANITTSTAFLSWGDANTTPAPNYDIYVVLNGSAAPINTTTATASSTTDTTTATGLTPATTYDYYVRGRCTATDTSAWAGPFTFTTLATCIAPSNLTATNITSSSVDMGWTENNSATQWDIELGLQNFTPSGSPTPGFGNITSNPFSLPGGLPPNTCFDFYVRSQCGAGDTSTWTGPYTFCTLVDTLSCPAGANPSIIFSEEFTNTNTSDGVNISAANLPAWTSNYISGNPRFTLTSTTSGSSSTGPSAGAQGSTGFALMEVSCVSGGNDTLTSPFIDLSNVAGAARLKFFTHMYGANSGKLEVFVDNSGTLTSIFVDSGQTQTSSTAAWDSAVVSLNSFVGQNIQLKFVGTAANPGGCAGDRGIDQVSVEACISCPAPSNISASNITGTSCDLSWTENGSATTWELEVVSSGTPPTGIADSVGVTTNVNKSITGLTQFQPVDFYVRSVCGAGDTSSWTGPYTVLPCAPLAGTYTIDPASPLSATNFQTMNEVATALQCGISAPVIFDMATGNSFNEQVIFDEVSGASATNTITFNGNGDTVTYAATVTGERHTIRLNGADYFRFNDLVIEATGGSFGFAMHLFNGGSNGTDSNMFTNCTFQVPTTATSTAICPFAVSGSLTSPTTACVAKTNGNIVDSCVARGGYYCMTNYGSFTAANYGAGNQIKNTEVVDFYAYGIYFLYQDDYLISNNNVHRDVRTNSTTCYGIYGSGITSNAVIEKNWVHNPFPFTTTSAFYGLEFFNDASSVATSTVVKNNLVEDVVSNGTQYGIYFSFANNIKVYHNTVVLDDIASTGTGDTRGIYQNGATSPGQDIQNNNVYITRGGSGTKHGIYNTASPVTCDYNNVYMAPAASNHYGYNGGSNQTTLAAWQASTPTVGANSTDVDPIFTMTAPDYSPSNAALNNVANTGLGVTMDFTGATRSATPDIGAFEFTVAPTDISVSQILSPDTTIGCYTAAETVMVELTNSGSTVHDFSVNPTTVTVQATTPGGPATLTATVNTGTLAVLGTLSVSVAPTVNMTANGAYTLDAYSNTTGDANLLNDTLATTYNYTVNLIAGTISASPDVICQSGTSDVTITGNAGAPIQWQTSTTGMAPWTNVGTGMNPHTSATLTTTTYYRALLTCNAASDSTNVDTIVVNNPMIATTMTDTVCGVDTVNLMATAVDTSNTISWYSSLTSTTALGTGTSFSTVISGTDTFYAAASAGGAGADTVQPGPQTGTYASGIRGYWFVAPTDFTITSLYVPTDYSATNLQTHGVYKVSSFPTTTFTTLYYQANVPVSQWASVSIPVLSGDTILMAGWRDGCSYGSAVTVTIDGNTVQTYRSWSNDMPNYSSIGAVGGTWNDGGTGSIGRSFFTYSLGCEGSRTAVVATSLTAPAITASNDSTVCWDSTVTVPMTVSSANTNYTYAWSPATALDMTTGDSVNASPLTPTQYVVTANDAATGCANTDTVNIAVQEEHYAVASTDKAYLCGTDSAMINIMDSIPAIATYCASGATNGFDTKIDTVSFAGVTTGTSPTAQETYTDYTATVIPATAGVALPLSIVNGSSSGIYYGGTVTVWIDYDHSGTFDAAEQVYQFVTTGLNTVPPTTITIPTSALNGPTRMRIICPEGGTTAACGTWAYGETEDYTVDISGATAPVTGSYTYTWMPGPLTGAMQTVTPATTTTYIGMQTDQFGCVAMDSVAIAVGAISGNLAQATPGNAASTAGTVNQTYPQPDGTMVNYYDASCNLINTVDDGAGGNVLGMVSSTVTVDATVPTHNGEPFTARWYQITPTSNGPADVVLYFTQDDFDQYNAHPAVVAGTHDSLPSGPLDLTGIANLRITKNDDAGLGVNPVELTPTSPPTWDALEARWEVAIAVPSFSQFRAHAVNPMNTPLPVSLTQFTVSKEGSVSLAAWVTAAEYNNSHFNLQRSLDGNTFATLGKVNTKAVNGNSTTELNYNFTDNAPQIGHNYYRLEQVDQDGNLSYSRVIDVVWGADGSIVSIYPNPATDKLSIDVSTDKVAQMEVRLLDMSGRVIQSVMQQTQKGMNNVSLNLSDIAVGVYGVQVYENNKLIHTTKVNKQIK